MRSWGATALLAAVLLIAAPSGAGAQTPAEDFATGVGHSLDFDFDFTARSGPSGENPTGHVSIDVLDNHLEGPVTCLNVTGSTATLVFTHDNPNFGPFALVTVVDNGAQGIDTIAGVTLIGPVDCSTPTTILQQPLFDGDIVVHDAPALPTLRDQCKNGGWRNFGTAFKNEGQCVAFVQRGPKA